MHVKPPCAALIQCPAPRHVECCVLATFLWDAYTIICFSRQLLLSPPFQTSPRRQFPFIYLTYISQDQLESSSASQILEADHNKTVLNHSDVEIDTITATLQSLPNKLTLDSLWDVLCCFARVQACSPP